MRAIAVNQYGAEPTLMDLPKPKPGPHQILIKVRDAGVNPMDRQMSNGRLQARMPAPATLSSASCSLHRLAPPAPTPSMSPQRGCQPRPTAGATRPGGGGVAPDCGCHGARNR